MPALTNPWPSAPEEGRICVDMDPVVHRAIFKHLLGGLRGARATVTNILYKKLYDAILAAGIPIVYDPDNESRLAELLDRCEFRPSVLEPTRPGRPNPRPAVRKNKRVSGDSLNGPAHCTSD